MSVIGVFVRTKEGGWTGTIRTLTVEVKARLVPNDNRSSEDAPAFRVFAGRSDIGAAWRSHTAGAEAREYLSVKLDDPCLPTPISAALFQSADGSEAQLVWSRRHSDA